MIVGDKNKGDRVGWVYQIQGQRRLEMWQKIVAIGCIVCIMATITIIHLVDGLSDSAAAAHSASHFVIFLQSSKIRERRIALLEFITQSP